MNVPTRRCCALVLAGIGSTLAGAASPGVDDAIVPLEHARTMSASVNTCQGSDSDQADYFEYGPWDVGIEVSGSCQGASASGEAEQHSFIEPARIFASSAAAGSMDDPAQTCGPVAAEADASFVLWFDLTRYAKITITASVSAWGGDTGYGQASVEFGSAVDLHAEGIGLDGESLSTTVTQTFPPGIYTLQAWAGGQTQSNCCCDVGTGDFEVDLVVHPAGDVNGDFVVDAFDLAMVLAEWGPCNPFIGCGADLNGDHTVDPLDLSIVLSTWSDDAG